MDINGAKALKERLGQDGVEAPPSTDPADVPADAPPVYHWTGKTPPDSASSEAADSPPPAASLFSRLSLGLR